MKVFVILKEDAVYAKDVLDIEQFSTVRGVTIEESDGEFYRKFATGATVKPWMNEMIEMGVFDELNVFGPDGKPSDDLIDPPPERERRGFFSRLFGRRVSRETLYRRARLRSSLSFFRGVGRAKGR